MRTLVIVLIAIAGCGRGRESVTARSESSAAPARRVDPSRELSPLVARLAYEAQHRRPSPVSAERVLDALAAADLAVVRRTQYLGATVRASYCAGGATSDGLVISVCEYPDADSAHAGRTFMNERFAAMTPAAKRAAQGATVLTIIDPDAPARAVRVERALEVFAAL